MTCDEFLQLAPAYALGALDLEERAAASAHLAEPTHRGCDLALRHAYATVGALGASLPPVAPGEGVWHAIEARLGSAAPPSSERRRRRAARVGWAAAAAAAVFLALFIGERRAAERSREAAIAARRTAQAEAQARDAVELELKSQRATAEVQREVLALLDTPGTRVVTLDPAPGRAGRAVAVVNVRTRLAVIVSASLSLQPGKTYQLWVIHGAAAPAAAGFLQPAGGVLVGRVDSALLGVRPDALAVSLEPAGGSPAPTDVQLVGKISG